MRVASLIKCTYPHPTISDYTQITPPGVGDHFSGTTPPLIRKVGSDVTQDSEYLVRSVDSRMTSLSCF